MTGDTELSPGKPVFVVGCDRSGTTFLGRIFGSHPEVAYVEEPELGYFVRDFSARLHRYLDIEAKMRKLPCSETLGGRTYRGLSLLSEAEEAAVQAECLQKTREFFHSLCDSSIRERGAKIFVEKTPQNDRCMNDLLNVFPDAKFVHIIRDGRDVAASYLSRGLFERWGIEVPEEGRIDWLAAHWRRYLTNVRQWGAEHGPARYREIFYESLTGNPEKTLSPVLEWVGLSWAPELDRFLKQGMGGGLKTDRIGCHRKVLTEGEIEQFERQNGDLLTELNYSVPKREQPEAGTPAPKSMKISAIVTSHNYGRYLAECLNSLLAQSHPFCEIIVVDDDSKDETAEVAAHFGGRIRYEKVSFRNVAKARQHAFAISKGDYVVPVDADDWLLPNYNERLIEPLLADDRVGISYCGAHFHFEEEANEWFPDEYYPLVTFDRELLRRSNFICNCSMVRREAWQGEDPALQGHYIDWDHWIRVVDKGWKAVLVPAHLFYYRIHKENSTYKRIHGAWQDAYFGVRERYLDKPLTILTLFSGKKNLLPAYLDALAHFRKPDDTQLLFIDDSRDVRFFNRLRKLNVETIVYPEVSNRPDGNAPYIENQQAVARHLASLYDFSKFFIRGRRLLIWEHDVIPQPDALEKLEKSAVERRADMIGAGVVSRKTAEFMAWRVKNANPRAGLYRVQAGRGLKRVFATSFSFLLMDTSLFFRMPLEASRDGLPFFGCDLNAGEWAFRKDMRWFMDGSVRCRHLDSDGLAVERGSLRHTQSGLMAMIRSKQAAV
ncbi:MAG: sulfotransferase [Candidatus Omnitrophota bacterium]|nr:sulfotransferase [Candidatus Omnitrophota bacterium]